MLNHSLILFGQDNTAVIIILNYFVSDTSYSEWMGVFKWTEINFFFSHHYFILFKYCSQVFTAKNSNFLSKIGLLYLGIVMDFSAMLVTLESE